MKKVFIISFLLLATLHGFHAYSQVMPTYPIPSFNIPVQGNADFREKYMPHNKNQVKARREVNIEVKSMPGTPGCTATVWVYSLDMTTILGPYSVDCGETLTVPIDERDWGVLVDTECEVIVNVWLT